MSLLGRKSSIFFLKTIFERVGTQIVIGDVSQNRMTPSAVHLSNRLEIHSPISVKRNYGIESNNYWFKKYFTGQKKNKNTLTTNKATVPAEVALSYKRDLSMKYGVDARFFNSKLKTVLFSFTVS